jgi:hypothetical protein
LTELVAKPELGPILAEEFQRVLVQPDTSFEVRKRLEALKLGLPDVAAGPAADVPLEEIDRLVVQMEDSSYSARLAAMIRLQWLLGNPKLACPIMLRLKNRLTRDDLSADGLRWMNPVYEEARGAWLLSDPEYWDLPPISDDQIRRWVVDLVGTAAAGNEGAREKTRQTAKRELTDLLARGEYTTKVQQHLKAALAQPGLEEGTKARLTEILDLTRPAMVAEYWERSHHLNVQRLLVDEPSFGPGATRASHFDRVDDEVAHCVSGQNLAPGDYPVGVAIPHPSNRAALFHLVNLPTPRRRMAYEYVLRLDETTRLRQLTRRTTARWLTRKKPLTDRELDVLGQLEAREVSRFAGQLFHAVDDQPIPTDRPIPSAPVMMPPVARGQLSHHAAICMVLAARGTREAIPGLLSAIDMGRFLPAPNHPSPPVIPWITALAIAIRDPWPRVDPWLAGLIEKPDLLADTNNGPELGATAAAILLERHQEKPPDFGLESAPDQGMARLGVDGYRFAGRDSRQKIETWFKAMTPDLEESARPDLEGSL